MLTRSSRAALLLFLAARLAGQTELPPWVMLLSKIKRVAKAAVENVSNYTCLETIEREALAPKGREFRLLDTVRVDVAVVGGQEMFSRPGARKFAKSSIEDFAPGGLVENGAFALHARSLFVGDTATFVYHGEERFQAAYRFDFRISRLYSGYRISGKTVPVRGSFWADRDSLDLIGIELFAEQIPVELGIAEAVTRISYGHVAIDATEVLLPRVAELVTTDFAGGELRNRMAFTACRRLETAK